MVMVMLMMMMMMMMMMMVMVMWQLVAEREAVQEREWSRLPYCWRWRCCWCYFSRH
jgi:hypothetical protein